MRSKLLFVTSVFVASCMVTAQMVWAKKERSHKVKRVFLAEEADSIALKTDSLLNDTTKMDSLQRAIFRYNQHIDDSLRKDSIARNKPSAIDAPVVYEAKDSLIKDSRSKKSILIWRL